MTTLTTAQIVSLFNDFANAEKGNLCEWLMKEGCDLVDERSDNILSRVESGLINESYSISYTYDDIDDLWFEFRDLCKSEEFNSWTQLELDECQGLIDPIEFCQFACPVVKPDYM